MNLRPSTAWWVACAGVAAAAVFAAASARAGDPAPPPDPLAGLRPEHPRLVVTKEQWSALRDDVRRANPPPEGSWCDLLRQRATALLAQPPVEHRLKGMRMLDQCRTAFDRVSLLAGLYRIDGETKFAERARQEMLAAAAFKDWNPNHFLDVAEMTAALALGYDWLFDFLSAEDRATVRAAIVAKGLAPGLAAHAAGTWWTKCDHNWNQVCHGGLALGALAVAEDEPQLARQVLALCLAAVPRAMARFAPDGGWPEGPGYWDYATQYNVLLVAALESAVGSDRGLRAAPGFAQTGLFRIHSTGPLGLTFNFADANAPVGPAPQMFWFARAFGQPAFAAHEAALARNRLEPWHLFWHGAGGPDDVAALPLDAAFRGVAVAFLRGTWNDPRATYVGFKGGDNKANHSHLDLGSFVLDAAGQRWVVDLGRDNYDLQGYFVPPFRWSYYRLRTEGHNTLTIGGPNQDPKAAAPLVAFRSQPGRSFAVADLTAAYGANAIRVQRGVALLARQAVLVRDELELARPTDVTWTVHTPAAIETQGAAATLTLGGQRLTVRALAPADAAFAVLPANPPAPQGQQPEVKRLVLRLRDATLATIVVLFEPPALDPEPATMPALAEWIKEGKLE